ncbi:olfactory receptor 52D1-like [Pelodiscus sinensis]|uniref:olfactory receptor 52D1-like n=1 Tax=Pelodiscus sinensis TaxID=13735 RepID=UPI003F6CB107
MAAFNLNASDPSTFILMGIPGLEAAHVWISIPFCGCYLIGLLGNFLVLFVVVKEQTLHQPMYLLLCMLAFADIATSSSVVPKALCIFWFNWKGITLAGCLTQTFFLNTVVVTESAVLVTMAFDRYVAICNPLRYSTILSNERIAKLGLVGLIRALLIILPMPLILSRLPFCDNRIIPQNYCDCMTVAKLSCGDIAVIKLHGLVTMVVTMGLDLMLIALSYSLIIRAVLRIPSKEAHVKALNTCTAHLCVMLLYCAPSLFSVMTHWFGQGIAPYIHVIFANVYLLVPSMLNPIIYGVKTKELREKMGQCLRRERVGVLLVKGEMQNEGGCRVWEIMYSYEKCGKWVVQSGVNIDNIDRRSLIIQIIEKFRELLRGNRPSLVNDQPDSRGILVSDTEISETPRVQCLNFMNTLRGSNLTVRTGNRHLGNFKHGGK